MPTVKVPTVGAPMMALKLTKMRSRTRYDIAGYESGGLPWGEVDPDGDGYLVATESGEALGCVYKWNDGEWTSSKLNASVKLDDAYAFDSRLYAGKTRFEALAKLVYWARK